MTENKKILLVETEGGPALQYRIDDEDLSTNHFVDGLIMQILSDRDRIEEHVASINTAKNSVSDIADYIAVEIVSGVKIDHPSHLKRGVVRTCVPTTTLLGSTRCCNVYSIACIGEDYMYRANVRVNMTDGSATTDSVVSNLPPVSEVKLLKTLLSGGCPEVLQDWVIGRLAMLKELLRTTIKK